MAFAGSALWLPPALEQRLRRYVDGGGRVASFGADAFRRGVRLGRDVARARPRRRARANAFGERTALLRTGAAPLGVFEDELGLFDELSGLIGEFTLFERSASLPPGARVLVVGGPRGRSARPSWPTAWARVWCCAAGRRSGRASSTEARLSVEVPRVTRRIWALLSGRGGLAEAPSRSRRGPLPSFARC